MLEGLLPTGVSVAETRGDLHTDLSPEEERVVSHAVQKRRLEFTTGRACARIALRRLGWEPTPVPSGGHGEPLWPPGIVGTITHCAAYRACAVAQASDFASLGIDAEVDEPLPDGILDEISTAPERRWTETNRWPISADRLLFSAKEAIYKAWFPLTGSWLDFDDAEITFVDHAQAFTGRLRVAGPDVDGERLRQFSGNWGASNGVLMTAIAVERSRTAG
jgi:4'-phosphopantetheinyl transferase EntD